MIERWIFAVDPVGATDVFDPRSILELLLLLGLIALDLIATLATAAIATGVLRR